MKANEGDMIWWADKDKIHTGKVLECDYEFGLYIVQICDKKTSVPMHHAKKVK